MIIEIILEYCSWCPLLIGLCLCLFLYKRQHVGRNLPPGPRGWPFIGILPDIVTVIKNNVHFHSYMTDMSLKYGPIISFKLIGKRIVVLNDFDSIKQGFENPHIEDVIGYMEACEYLDRPSKPLPWPGGRGIVFGSGKPWRENRKFFLTYFRKFARGETNFETLIATEVKCLVAAIGKTASNSFNPTRVLSNATANIIAAVVLGKRFDYEDEEFSRLLESFEAAFAILDGAGLMLMMPRSIAALLMRKEMEELYDIVVTLRNTFGKVVNEHIAKGVDPADIRDITDAYLLEMARNNQANVNVVGFDLPNLISAMTDMFGAGMETSCNTLRWGLLYMVTYPEIQKRIQHDIDDVIGKNLPTESARPRLPYIEATILEILRIQCVAPFIGLRQVSKNTTIGGYDIPTGSIVFANLWKVLHEPHLWEEPDRFMPERFLDNYGQLKVPKYMIPFSVGRRECLGKKIASSSLFIFFTHLLQKFTFTVPEGNSTPSFTGISGLTNAPNPFEVCAWPRI